METLKQRMMNIQNVLQSYPEVTVIAVTKGRTVEEIKEVMTLGIRHIGENYLQEAEQKFSQLTTPVIKHFIGRLQSNKIKKIVPLFDVIQSVDSYEKLLLIDQIGRKYQKKMQVLLQVNISNEPQKGGMDQNEVLNILKNSKSLRRTEIVGLMGMAEESTDQEKVRSQFRFLKTLFEKAKTVATCPLTWLSMGMTEDYQIALQEGSTMLRLGRALFGERKTG